MGSLGYTIRLTNHGHGACRISAGLVLYQTASGGVEKRIPIETETAHPKSLLLAAGKTIETNVLITNGYGGYAPDSPHCAHPVVYRGISVGVGSGLVALPQLVLDVKCDGVRAYDWYLA